MFPNLAVVLLLLLGSFCLFAFLLSLVLISGTNYEVLKGNNSIFFMLGVSLLSLDLIQDRVFINLRIFPLSIELDLLVLRFRPEMSRIILSPLILILLLYLIPVMDLLI